MSREEFYYKQLIKCYDIMLRHEKIFWSLFISLSISVALNLYLILNK